MKSLLSLTLLLFACCSVLCHGQEAASQTKKKSANPSGTWRMEFEWSGTEVKDAFRLQQDGEKLLGTLLRNDTELKIDNGKVEKDMISFTVTMDYEGTEFTTKYSGKVDGDTLDGTAIIDANGETMEFPWKPKRSVEMADLVGTWNLTIESPDGNVFKPTLKILKEGDKYLTEYGSEFGEIDLEDVRVEDNDLRFTLNTEYEGSPIKLDYSGRAYGNQLDGTVEYDLAGNTGDMPFSAKRKKADKK